MNTTTHPSALLHHKTVIDTELFTKVGIIILETNGTKKEKHKHKITKSTTFTSHSTQRPHDELLAVPLPLPRPVSAHPRSRLRSADGSRGIPTNCAYGKPPRTRDVNDAAACMPPAPALTPIPKPARSVSGPLGSRRTNGGIYGGT